MPKEVRGLDNPLEEGFNCLGSTGPTVRGTMIVPSYAEEGSVSPSTTRHDYWVNQEYRSNLVGINWAKGKVDKVLFPLFSKSNISTNWETSLEVIKFEDGGKDSLKKKARGEAGTSKNPNKRKQVT